MWFCVPEWLDPLEAQKLRYIVVARLLQPMQRLLRHDLIWEPSEVPGTEMAEVWHQEINWPQPRRLILLRHRVAEKKRRDRRQETHGLPGYLFQALVTNTPSPRVGSAGFERNHSELQVEGPPTNSRKLPSPEITPRARRRERTKRSATNFARGGR